MVIVIKVGFILNIFDCRYLQGSFSGNMGGSQEQELEAAFGALRLCSDMGIHSV